MRLMTILTAPAEQGSRSSKLEQISAGHYRRIIPAYRVFRISQRAKYRRYSRLVKAAPKKAMEISIHTSRWRER